MNYNNYKIDHLIKLTKLISSLELLGDEQILYQQVDEFLIETFDNIPHWVFSHSVNSSGKPVKRKLRSLWNRNMMKSLVSMEQLFEIVNKLVQNSDGLTKVHKIKINDFILYFFNYGVRDDQLVWGVIPTSRGLNTENIVFYYLLKHLKNYFASINQINVIRQIGSLAFVDDITGFYNHRKMVNDIEDLILKNKKIDEYFTLLFIDIDHFKDVNDGFGHVVGTQLLTDFSIRLKILVRDSDLIYRYGGDEFVVILTNTKYIDIEDISARILSGIKDEKFMLDSGEEYALSISIGIARFPEDATTGKEIINIADEMMYTAKKQGRGRVCLAKICLGDGD